MFIIETAGWVAPSSVAEAVVAGAVVIAGFVVVVAEPLDPPAGALEREPSSQPAMRAVAMISPTAALKTRRPARITHFLQHAGSWSITRVRDMSHMSQTIGRAGVYH
jgi:hypothetical protein